MRTSLNEIQLIERHIHAQVSAEESHSFSLRLAGDKVLRFNFLMQQRVYQLLRQYHRRRLKEHADVVHRRLLDDPAHQHFQKSISNLFNTFQ